MRQSSRLVGKLVSLLTRTDSLLPQVGYRDGLEEGKEITLQQGFNLGKNSRVQWCMPTAAGWSIGVSASYAYPETDTRKRRQAWRQTTSSPQAALNSLPQLSGQMFTVALCAASPTSPERLSNSSGFVSM